MTDDRIPGMFITAAQLADSLARDGYDPNITVGSVWQDRYHPGLPDGHVRLVKITYLGKQPTGWQARIHTYHGAEPADWIHPATGTIFLDRLVVDYRRRDDLTEPEPEHVHHTPTDQASDAPGIKTGVASRRGTRDHNCDSAAVYAGPDTTTAVIIDGTGDSADLATLTDALAITTARTAYRHGGLAALITAGDLTLDDAEGAAVLAAVDQHGEATVAWIGDCRAYHWHTGTLTQATTDHTMGEQLRQSGGVPAEIAATHDHWLLVGLSGATAATVRQVGIPDPSQVLEPGDLIVLTSDGVHDQIDHSIMTAIAATHSNDPQALAEALVAAVTADEGGYRDDATVVVLAFEPAR